MTSAMSGWEVAAVILALAYLLLAMKEKISCWYAAFASTAIYTFLFFDVHLFMESALQLYYLGMAVYGWWLWKKPAYGKVENEIHTWKLSQHLAVITVTLLLTVISGTLLAKNTTAAMPFLDSFITWGSVITTWMVARKVLENWLYWIVIDALSVYVYFDRELYLTAILFVLYVLLAVIGYFEWHKRHQCGNNKNNNKRREPCLSNP